MVHVYPKSGFFLNAETGQGVRLKGMADIVLPYDLQVIGVLAFIAFAVAAVVSNLMIVFPFHPPNLGIQPPKVHIPFPGCQSMEDPHELTLTETCRRRTMSNRSRRDIGKLAY